jgi:exodeoxyribonuclease V alpha subunit
MDLFEHAERKNAEKAPEGDAPARAAPRPFVRPALFGAPIPVAPRPAAAPPRAAAQAARPAAAYAPRRGGSMAANLTMESNDPDAREAQAAAGRAAPVQDDTIELRGRVKNERFYAPDSGYTVLVVRFDNERDDMTLQVTTTVRAHPNDRIVALGKWSTYKGKPQFKAEMIQLEIPREARGIVEWLRNGGVPGVGKAAIKRLVDYAGDGLPDIVDNADETVKSGISMKQAQAIAKAWSSNAAQPRLTSLLGGVGLKPRQIAKVIETYGAYAEKLIDTNPWALLDEVEGIGFVTADRIAQLRGLDMSSPSRILAGLAWVLNECLARDGHCGMPPLELRSSAARMLDVSEGTIDANMGDFVDGVRVVHDDGTGLVYAKSLWECEHDLAHHLAALVSRSGGGVDAAEAEAAVLRAERELGVSLDRDGGQFEAACMALVNAVCIITGGPGTGKSTTQKVIVTAMGFVGKKAIALSAPTGRAAKRLAETSGREARTIHRLLDFSPQIGDFSFNENSPLRIDAVIVDEVSMVDVRLFAALTKALPQDACLVLVGDFDQLPSVGPGQVLRDMIASDLLPTAKLTRVHRQAAGSGIAVAAQRINHGLPPVDHESPMMGFQLFDYSDPAIIEEVVNLVRFVLPEAGFDPMRDVQVLAPMRRGEYGVEALNAALKAALNPAVDGDPNSVSIVGRVFTVGDRVMQRRNDYQKGVYNGEVGAITAVGTSPDEDGRRTPFITVDFSGVAATYRPEDVEDVELAYAATVHKSQGCEFPVVIFVAPHDHRRMLNRNLIYTGVTRAKSECILIGDRAVIDHAVKVSDSFRRHTGLQIRLAEAMAEYGMAA